MLFHSQEFYLYCVFLIAFVICLGVCFYLSVLVGSRCNILLWLCSCWDKITELDPPGMLVFKGTVTQQLNNVSFKTMTLNDSCGKYKCRLVGFW